jgi:hypothetical protein
VIIIYSVLVTATILKGNGYPNEDYFVGPFAHFVRHYGLVLILIPAMWAAITIWVDRLGWNYARLFTFISGLLVIFLLFQLSACSAAQSERKVFIKAID